MLTLFGLLTALPAVLALHLLEPELVLPAFSALLFVEAAFAVIAARLIRDARRCATDITLWDLRRRLHPDRMRCRGLRRAGSGRPVSDGTGRPTSGVAAVSRSVAVE